MKNTCVSEEKPAILTIAFLLFSIMALMFPASARAVEPIVVKSGMGKYSIGKHLQILEDKDNSYTIKDVRGKELSGKFVPSTQDIPSLGYSKSSYWLKFTINIPAGFNEGVNLECTNPFIDLIELYYPQNDGTYNIKKGGDTFPFHYREVDYKNIILKLTSIPGNYEYYIKVKNKGSFRLPFYVLTNEVLFHEMSIVNTIDGIVYGIMIFIIISSTLISIILKKYKYSLLGMAILFQLLKDFNYDGTGFQFLWSNSLWFNDSLVINSFLFIISASIFLILLFNLKQKATIIYFVLITFASIGIIAIISYITFIPYSIAMPISSIVDLSFSIILIPIFIYLYYKTHKSLFLIIPLVMCIVSFLWTLDALGYLPSILEWQLYAKLISLLISCLFTFIMLDEIYSVQKAKLRFQQEANNTLELKVEERTKELAHALDEVETINERLTESNTKLEGLGNSLRKYLPHQLVSSIMDGKVAACNETERKKITIFFSDIKAFTDTTDSLEAEELSNLLNEYLTEMTKIAAKYGGTIDKFIGDAVMIFFGAPESSGEKEDALRCVRMAVEMQARMKELNEKWFNQGFERPLEIRIGINTGVATVGDFGAEERLSYTTIGGQVNIASRLESMCEPGKILISHATWALVKDEFNCNPRGAVQVKGIHHDVLVYEVEAG